MILLLVACVASLVLSPSVALSAFKLNEKALNQERPKVCVIENEDMNEDCQHREALEQDDLLYPAAFNDSHNEKEALDEEEPEIYEDFLMAEDSDWEDIHEDCLYEEAAQNNIDAQIALGNRLYQNGEVTRAEAAFKQAAGESAVACFNLALFYHKEELWDEAQAYYHKALEMDDTPYQTHINLGAIYYSKGDIDKAEKYFKKAAHYDLDFDFQSLHNMALVYAKKNDSARYNQCMERANLKKVYVRLLDTMDAIESMSNCMIGKGPIYDELYEKLDKEISTSFVECKKELRKPFTIEVNELDQEIDDQ